MMVYRRIFYLLQFDNNVLSKNKKKPIQNDFYLILEIYIRKIASVFGTLEQLKSIFIWFVQTWNCLF